MFVLRHTILNLFKYTHIADREDQTQIRSDQNRSKIRPVGTAASQRHDPQAPDLLEGCGAAGVTASTSKYAIN